METKLSSGIDFIIRKSKADEKKAYIFARITVSGQRNEISIKEQVNIASWNSLSETVKGNTLEVKQLNHTIENIRYRIKEKYRELDDRGELITAESLR